MKTLKSAALCSLIVLLPACGQQLVEFGKPATADGGSTDAKAAETAIIDTRNTEAGSRDAMTADAASPDGRSADAGTIDVATLDSANPDVRAIDAGSTDVVGPDAANADASGVDAANIDAANRDLANADVTIPDAITADAANPANPDVSIIGGGSIDAANSDVSTVNNGDSDAPNRDVANPDATTSDGVSLDATPFAAGDADKSDGANSDTGKADTISPCAQSLVALGVAGNFAVLAGATVTNVGPTSVAGDLGVSPGTAVTGFPPGTIVGAQHAGDPTAAEGVADLTTAYNDAAGRTLCPVTIAGNIGGQTLTPGLYKSTSSLEISSGDLTLDAQGDADAVFIFQIASTLTTTSARLVVLSGGAKSTNVFWQVGTSATLGTTSAFQGTIMADQAITLNTGATLNGRALARIAAVTLDSNSIVKPAP